MAKSSNNKRLVSIDQRAFILNDLGQLLLTKEEGFDWDLPGGFFEEGTNWREALESLIADNLELQIITKDPIFASDFIDPETGEYIYMSVILAESFKDEFDPANYEEVKWFDLAELTKLAYSNSEIKNAIINYLTKS